MAKRLIDKIRDVPEFAVRIYLGADVSIVGDKMRLELDGREYFSDPETIQFATEVAKVLEISPKTVETATDVLELRHKAEDIYLHQLCLGDTKLRSCLFVPCGPMAGSYYRSMMPADSMNTAGKVIAHHTNRLDLAKAARYDAVWVQLAAVPQLRVILEAAKKDGIKILYDLDDRPDVIPEHNPSHKVFEGWQLQEILEMMQLADVVTVSTRTLAQWAREHARKVAVAPNMLPAAIWPAAPRRPRDHVKILWAGSPTHGADLDLVALPLSRILQEGDGRVRFVCFGEELPKILHSASKWIDQIGFVDYEDYAERLASIDADIGIAPLADLPFNHNKSGIKALEYAGCGYLSLVSPVGEYPELILETWSSGRLAAPDMHQVRGLPGGIVQNKDWYFALKYWTARHRETIHRAGDAARKWVDQNKCLISSQAQPWVDALNLAFED